MSPEILIVIGMKGLQTPRGLVGPLMAERGCNINKSVVQDTSLLSKKSREVDEFASTSPGLRHSRKKWCSWTGKSRFL